MKTKKNIMLYVKSTIKCTILFLLILVLTQENTKHGYSNALFASGALFFSMGILIYVTNNGVFDLFTYGIKSVFSKSRNRMGDTFEYVSNRESIQCVHTIIVGTIFIILAYILI